MLPIADHCQAIQQNGSLLAAILATLITMPVQAKDPARCQHLISRS